ncbi:transposase [Fluviispira multicolorata]|uniref:Transposase DDE domain-containing protein n=1 Tax=Fluviispira multicolorata TaxID=2654512 RepID=A0A833N0B3_9BACT|nr:hypothetical protein GCL57_13220 [Fluviispira multicolorata]
MGFKYHTIFSKFGYLISFSLKHANCDDKKALSNIFSKIFAARGYIGKPFFHHMKDKLSKNNMLMIP